MHPVGSVTLQAECAIFLALRRKIDKHVLIRMPPQSAAELTASSIKRHLADTLHLKSTQLLDGQYIQTRWRARQHTLTAGDVV